MKVNEDLSILFWLNRQKASKDGLVGYSDAIDHPILKFRAVDSGTLRPE